MCVYVCVGRGREEVIGKGMDDKDEVIRDRVEGERWQRRERVEGERELSG